MSIATGVISLGSSLGGLLGGNAQRARAEAARAAAMADVEREISTGQYQQELNNRTNLLAATGQGGDALMSLGRNLGSAAAAGGVYNSSAVAGALAQGQAGIGSQLAGLARQNLYNERATASADRRYLAGLRYSAAGEDLQQANQDIYGSRQGLASFLGSLSQYNLARSGYNQTQNALARGAGGYGSSGVLAPGAGLGSFGTPGITAQTAGLGPSNPFQNQPVVNLPPRPTASIGFRY